MKMGIDEHSLITQMKDWFFPRFQLHWCFPLELVSLKLQQCTLDLEFF